MLAAGVRGRAVVTMFNVEVAPLTLVSFSELLVKLQVEALGSPAHERVMLDP